MDKREKYQISTAVSMEEVEAEDAVESSNELQDIVDLSQLSFANADKVRSLLNSASEVAAILLTTKNELRVAKENLNYANTVYCEKKERAIQISRLMRSIRTNFGKV